MASVSKVSAISKIFTKLGDNTNSLIPMYAKDVTSDTLTSLTYYREGGNRDWAEKTLEEFGTGVVWLGGIPLIKKIFDKTVYKKAGINPDIDAKRLFSGNDKNVVDTVEFAKEKASSLGSSFKEQTDILTHTIKNKTAAKNLALGKFGLATALTGLGLFGIITYKQKQTEKAVEKQVRDKLAKEKVLKNAINETPVYQAFKGNKKTENNDKTSFKGLGTFFMTNPIANTSLVDCVITGTRLAQARKGERFEVGLKEACEIAFIYGLAAPLQKLMESIGKKVFNKPINLDYAVLDSDVLKQVIQEEKNAKGTSKLLKQAKEIVSLAEYDNAPKGNINGIKEKGAGLFKKAKINPQKNESAKKVIDYLFDNQDSAIADVFKKSGNVGVFKTKEGAEQLSLLSSIDTDKLKTTAQNTIDIIENAAKEADITKYLKKTKCLKGAAIIANIGISAILMGYLQPKLNLYLRKKLHGGSNTNPAIEELTKQMEQKMAFEGCEQNNKCETKAQ